MHEFTLKNKIQKKKRRLAKNRRIVYVNVTTVQGP